MYIWRWETPGQDFGIGGIWARKGKWGVQFTSNRRPRWTDPVTARRVSSKWKGIKKGNKGNAQGEVLKQGECVMYSRRFRNWPVMLFYFIVLLLILAAKRKVFVWRRLNFVQNTPRHIAAQRKKPPGAETNRADAITILRPVSSKLPTRPASF